MKPNELKVFTYITIGLAGSLWATFIVATKADVVSYSSLKALNAIAGAVSLLWLIYFKWAWRKPYIRKIIFRPDLNGTWLGQFRSDWTNSNGDGVHPGDFILVIRQNFFTISIRAYTEKMKTESYGESLVLNAKGESKMIAYLYTEKRTSNTPHGTRQGAAELELIESNNERLLEGDFWTHNKTTGYVRVKHINNNLFIEYFTQAKLEWPKETEWAKV